MQRTSLTDDNKYPNLCYLAAKNDEVFKNFRRASVYLQIVEGVTVEYGRAYLEMILNNYGVKLSAEQWENILLNDKLGNPFRYTYEFGDNVLTCAPITLRYTKVLCDVAALFPTDVLNRVAEIGIGYGGQCRLMMNFLPIERYNLIDLPEVLMLAERFLTELDVAGDIRYIDGTHLYDDVPCDFVISNYAFSELTKPVQEHYIDKVIAKSKAGYMTWNYSAMKTGGWTQGYELEDILSMIPGATTIPEEPLTSIGTSIIVWGTK